mgnify:CR=1 FL=1
MGRLMSTMKKNGIEFRLGSAGGGNQLRQPYLKDLFPNEYYKQFKNTEHIHFFGMYLGNYPELELSSIQEIAKIISSNEIMMEALEESKVVNQELVEFLENSLNYVNNYKFIFVVLIVFLTFISYIGVSIIIKAFKISDINLKY